MRLGTYGILIALGLFILLMIINPRLSCFGKRIRSPLYPVLRRRRKKVPPRAEAQDYGFHLVENPEARPAPSKPEDEKTNAERKTDDYGFRLDK
jgi:hypothetical protein